MHQQTRAVRRFVHLRVCGVGLRGVGGGHGDVVWLDAGLELTAELINDRFDGPVGSVGEATDGCTGHDSH